MNQKFLINKNQNPEELEKEQRRNSQARHILQTIKRSKSTWMKIEMIKQIYFYVNYRFVQEELRDIYKNKETHPKVRQAIKDLHNGDLDVSDLIAEREENAQLFAEYEKFKNEFELENQEITDYDKNLVIPKNLDHSNIALLKYRTN